MLLPLWASVRSGSVISIRRSAAGYHETDAKKEGLIRCDLRTIQSDWSEVILKGPQIGVATPFFKQPPETGTKGRPQDLTTLPVDALPRSEYARATDIETYRAAQDKWVDHRDAGRRVRTQNSTGCSGGA